MEYKIVNKPAFSVIGRLGSTEAGEGFIARLWQQANENFSEVAPLAKKKADGSFAGFWGLMSDMGMNFAPWEDGFTRGLYLAGVEVESGAEAPEGWVKWEAPAREYLVAPAGPFPLRWSTLRSRAGPSRGQCMTLRTRAPGKRASIFPLTKLMEMRYHYDRGNAKALS